MKNDAEKGAPQETEHRWPFAIRGVAALIMGIIILALTEVEKGAPILIVYVFAFFCHLQGLTAAAESILADGRLKRWWPLLAEGIVGILMGGLMLRAPIATSRYLPYFICFWAIPSGILQIFWAERFRDVFYDRWLFSFAGFMSLLLGVLVITIPRPGVLAVAWPLGCYGVLFGAIMIGVASYLKAVADRSSS